jgi:predicted lipoprotein with Yx(FWY)xxD motif
MKNALLVAALLQAAVAFANPTVETNGVLASRDGRTLYTFDKDQPGRSNCSGGCLGGWPAFTVADPSLAGGDFAVITRDDGTKQWAHQGRPLYFFAGDAKAGDINGDNQGGVWHVIRSAPKKKSWYSPSGDSGYSTGYSYRY